MNESTPKEKQLIEKMYELDDLLGNLCLEDLDVDTDRIFDLREELSFLCSDLEHIFTHREEKQEERLQKCIDVCKGLNQNLK